MLGNESYCNSSRNRFTQKEIGYLNEYLPLVEGLLDESQVYEVILKESFDHQRIRETLSRMINNTLQSNTAKKDKKTKKKKKKQVSIIEMPGCETKNEGNPNSGLSFQPTKAKANKAHNNTKPKDSKAKANQPQNPENLTFRIVEVEAIIPRSERIKTNDSNPTANTPTKTNIPKLMIPKTIHTKEISEQHEISRQTNRSIVNQDRKSKRGKNTSKSKTSNPVNIDDLRSYFDKLRNNIQIGIGQYGKSSKKKEDNKADCFEMTSFSIHLPSVCRKSDFPIMSPYYPYHYPPYVPMYMPYDPNHLSKENLGLDKGFSNLDFHRGGVPYGKEMQYPCFGQYPGFPPHYYAQNYNREHYVSNIVGYNSVKDQANANEENSTK